MAVTRRDLLSLSAAGLVAGTARAAAPPDGVPARPYLTPAKDFADVSRGSPVPHSLKGDALVKAGLTPATWKLDITAEDKATFRKPLSLDFKSLLRLGEKHGVKFLKAMQCNNIPRPLGQGLWEGVPLRVLLNLCGEMNNVRRVFYHGFHNNEPKQMFRSSLALSQVLDGPPGELPPFLAYRLNGEPIPLVRGGPVRMIVPWAHGFKSIKWLQKITLTNDHKTNDTYADANNDPESYLKTAAYFDETRHQTFGPGPVLIRGTCMVGWPGLQRVEYWLRADDGRKAADDDPTAEWKACVIDPPPADFGARGIWGFDDAGKPKEWPLRYSIAHWSLLLRGLKPGEYEIRVRTVDKNGFAQPEPRPYQKSGKNAVQVKKFTRK